MDSASESVSECDTVVSDPVPIVDKVGVCGAVPE